MTEQSPSQPIPSPDERPVTDATKIDGIPAPDHIRALRKSLERDTDSINLRQTPIGSIPQDSYPKYKKTREDVLD